MSQGILSPIARDEVLDRRLPPDWRVQRLKFALRSLEQGWSPACDSRPAEKDEWGVLKVGCVNGTEFDPTENKALPSDLQPIRVLEIRPGDILMSRANTRELLGSAVLVRNPPPQLLLCDKLYRLKINPAVIHPSFLVWALSSRAARDQLERDATGASSSMQNIAQSVVRELVLPLPPLEEQRTIADYLDEKTAAVDALTARRERHIELLEEKRQTVLVDRVTRGLESAVPMRESGVGWLGAVPAHWKVAPTRFVARLETGHTPSRQHPEYWVSEECTVPWFTLADVWQIRDGRQEYLGDTAEKVSSLGLANSAARLLPAETVVLSRTASVGFSGIMPVPMATSQDFVNWVCGPEIRPLYLLYVFRAMRQEFRRLTMGSTHQTIYMPDVRDFRTPLPPLEEQDTIVAAIQAEMARHDGLVARIRKQIEKLREYRRTLISAAVTGQIPVREEVPA